MKVFSLSKLGIIYRVDYQQQTFDISAGNNVTSKRNETMTYEAAVTRRDDTFNLYAILIFTSAILALIKSYAILKFCRRASIKIHQMMCDSVINSAMTFLDCHFIGNILNRFSYDLDVIDEQFPFIFMEFFRVGNFLWIIYNLFMEFSFDVKCQNSMDREDAKKNTL